MRCLSVQELGHTGGGLGLKPRFWTCLTSATGRFFDKWKPKPVIAVRGMSSFAMPLRLRYVRSTEVGRQKWQHLNWHSPPLRGIHGFF